MGNRPPIGDRAFRWLGIPLFGLAMPLLGRLFGPHGPGTRPFWWGLALFIGLAAMLWQGQRFFLVKQNEHAEWFSRPAQKLLLLSIGLVFGTVPLTLLGLLLWYRLAGFAAPDWTAIRAVVLLNLGVVTFLSYVYETWFFARSPAAVPHETQVEPTLMVNALSAIGWMIERDPGRAQELSGALGRVYRYLLSSSSRDLVLLSEEVAFIQDYLALLAVRFDDAVSLDIRVDDGALPGRLLPPVVLQSLVENALKRNGFSRQQPLRLDLEVHRDEVVLSNSRQSQHPLAEPLTPGVQALREVAERFRLATATEIGITTLPHRLSVRLPLLSS